MKDRKFYYSGKKRHFTFLVLSPESEGDKRDGRRIREQGTKDLEDEETQYYRIGMCIGVVIVTVSLIYEFIFKAQEEITGTIVGIVAILISVQFYTTMDIKESIRGAKEGIGERIREERDAILGKLK